MARVIGTEGFGAIAFGAAVIVYFQSMTDWGFKFTAVREISLANENTEKISVIFSRVIGCKVFLIILSAIILYGLISFIPLFKQNEAILWSTFLLIPGYAIFPTWLFQGMQEMKYITIVNISSKIIFTILVFSLIKEKEDYIYEPMIQATGFFISGLFGFVYAINHFKLKFKIPKIKDIFMMLRSSWDMFISQFFPTLHQIFSMIMLEGMAGTKSTGLFSAGHRFISIIDALSQTLSNAFYPFLARRMDKHNLYVLISGSISVFMSCALFFSASVLVKIFYTPEFDNTVDVIKIMSLSPIFLFLLNSFGNNGLSLIGKEHVLRNIGIVCTIIGLMISFLAIYFWSYYGMAIAVTATWGLRGIFCWVFYRKYQSEVKSKSIN